MGKSLNSMYIRWSWGRSDAKRDEGLTTPSTIDRVDNISYGPDKKYNLLDVYRPKASSNKKLPVIVNIHGGGWVYGTKEIYQYYCMSLAEQGFAVVNFNYRLAPENKFPAQLIDVNRVFNFIQDNATAHGFDIDNVFIVGDSAGAQIAGLYTSLITNPNYRQAMMPLIISGLGGFDSLEFKLPDKICIRALGLNCGVYHFDTDAKDRFLREYIKFSKDPSFNSMLIKLVSVNSQITRFFPPCFVMSCEGDFLRDEVPLIEKVLEDNHVEYISKVLGTKEEPLWHVFHVNMKMDIAHQINREECEFFKSKIVL